MRRIKLGLALAGAHFEASATAAILVILALAGVLPDTGVMIVLGRAMSVGLVVLSFPALTLGLDGVLGFPCMLAVNSLAWGAALAIPWDWWTHRRSRRTEAANPNVM